MNKLTHHEAGALLAGVGRAMMLFDLCAAAALDDVGRPWVALAVHQEGIDLMRAEEIVAIPDVLELAIEIINV